MQTKTRIEGLINHAQKKGYKMPHSIWFSTYDQVLTQFHSDIWKNAYDETAHV